MEVKEFIESTADIFLKNLDEHGHVTPEAFEIAAMEHGMDVDEFRALLNLALDISRKEMQFKIMFRRTKVAGESVQQVAERLGLHESQVRRFLMEEVKNDIA